jgi:ADP-ribose pyrophosphatase YjhB (NUDIX family)
MAKFIYGDRITKHAKVRLGCSTTIFDGSRQKILLTKRTDNGQWCLPSGCVDAGESVAEACEREVLEETGLIVRAKKLIGVYSDPHMMVEYADGNRFQIVALNFEAEIISGELMISNETTAVDFFDKEQIKALDIMQPHRVRLEDVWVGRLEPFIR